MATTETMQAMGKSCALHVGLDVHANSIDVTVAEAGAGGEVRHVGATGGDLASLDRAQLPRRASALSDGIGVMGEPGDGA